MWGREYVACAILCMGDPSLEEIAKENDFPMVDIQDAWFVFVTQSTSPLKKDDWKDLWKQAGVPIPDERRVRSGYLSETTKGDDKLSIEQEVQAFSQLIADSKTAPPLSLGLLGDWGAGKTFFMESLKEGVETLTGTEDYCENIAQVQFNAWHLSDANLWASVVDHIFEEVWKKVSRSGDEDTLEGTRQKVQEEIRGARGAVYEAERQLEVTLDTLHAAEEEHKILSAQLAVEKVAGSARKKALETVLTEIGWKQPINSIADIDKSLRELGESGKRVRTVLGVAMQGQTLLLAGVWFGVIVLGAVALAAASAFVPMAEVQETLRFLAALGGSVGAVVGAAATALSKASSVVNRFADELTKTVEEYESKIDGNEVFQSARKKHAEVEARLQGARAKLGELEGYLAGLDPSRRLISFIEERARSEDYRSRQGIISLVRRDFEELAKLMHNWKRSKEKRPSDDFRPIDRIVLYVDDLDRCSPEVVVQTLEASPAWFSWSSE